MEFLAFLLYTTILEGSVFVYDKELLPGEMIKEQGKSRYFSRDDCIKEFIK